MRSSARPVRLRAYPGVLFCVLFLALALFGGPARAVPEYDLKAAFVYNFALFTDWPAATFYEGGTLNICANPASPMFAALTALGEKVVRGRRINVRQLVHADTVRSCHVLVLDVSDRPRWGALRAAAAGTHLLVISDDPELSKEGCAIALGLEGGRVVFDVDTRVAREAQLILSSKLLRLARSVQ